MEIEVKLEVRVEMQVNFQQAPEDDDFYAGVIVAVDFVQRTIAVLMDPLPVNHPSSPWHDTTGRPRHRRRHRRRLEPVAPRRHRHHPRHQGRSGRL